MADTRGYVNLDYCVNNALVDIQDYSTTNYKRFFQWAVRAFRQLNLFVTPNIKVEYVTVNNLRVIDFPEDMIMYSKIGIISQGRIYTLTLNENLQLRRQTDDCGTLLPPTDTTVNLSDISSFPGQYGYYYAQHYRNGQYTGEMYGRGGGFNRGYYRIDWDRRQIQFDSTLPEDTEVVIEYISSGIEPDGSTVVPIQAAEAIIAYIHWQRLEMGSGPQSGMRRKEMEWAKHLGLLDKMTGPTLDEYVDSTYRAAKASPTR